MKRLALLLLSIASYGAELIYISNNATPQNLQLLHEKYKQPLLLNGSNIYLIPDACRLERYFGGASEGELKRIAIPMQAESITVTQEVFEAKDEQTILKKIEVKKSIALVEGKVSKAFLEDKEGRGFGGASEVPIDLSGQKQEVIETAREEISLKEKVTPHPGCHMLNDGSGYMLENAVGAHFYPNDGFMQNSDNVVLFK